MAAATTVSDVGSTVSTGAILFTDMVDSTALRSRLGDDRADLLRGQHDNLLKLAIETHRGTVLRWTGDGVKAGFPTSSDAVAAAVAIQRAVTDYGASDQAIAVFQVRVGLSVGEVTIDEGGDHRGVAVIEAARLEALARPGEILVTDMVRMLGSRRSNVTFEEVGERSLKGLDLPVFVHRVVDLSSAPVMPRMLAAEPRLPLVGRAHHVDEFHSRWDRARTGTASLMLVRGQPGIGKTRFVSHCAALAHANGAMVLGGACSSDLSVPYEPFTMAFNAISGLDETLNAAIGSDSGPLARLFPGSTLSFSESQPATAQLDLFGAVAALIRRLSRTRPLLLVLDDLHWATASTVMLLRHLIADADDQRLLIMATCREADLDSSHPVRRLLGEHRTSVVDLATLTESDVAQLVTAIAPGSPITRVAAIAQTIHGESAGNAFFACELIHHMGSTGQLDPALDGHSASQIPIPDSVHDVVTQRLSSLPTGAEEVLTLAAVIGPTFHLELLAAVTGRHPDDLLDLLDEVDRAGIITELGVDRFGFVHAIVRTTLLDELTATRRARAHRRVAEALESRGAEQFDELARHWQLAGEEARSTKYLARAARRDMVALAFESAKAQYRQVIDLLARDPHADVTDRAEAWLGLAAASRALGDPTFTQAVVRAGRLARSARSARLMGEAATLSTWLGATFFTAELPDVELIELCEDALSLVPASDPMRVRILATLASHLTFAAQREPRVKLIEEATGLAAQHRDPTLTAAVLHAEFTCLWEPATLERREQVARELGRIARATGDSQIEFFSGFFTAYCLTERGDLPASRAQFVNLRSVVETTKNPYFDFLTERIIVSIDVALGAGAQQLVDGLQQRFGTTQVDAEATWLVQTGHLAYQAGTLGQMLHAVEAMTTGAQTRMWAGALAVALMWSGDNLRAAELIDDGPELPKNYFWLPVAQARAEVAAGIGHTAQCRQMFDEMLPFRGRFGVTGGGSMCFGLTTRTLGMLALAVGEPTTAIELLTDAAEHSDRIGATYEGVASRRLLAGALIATGETEQAVSYLSEALPIAIERAYTREAVLIRELIPTAAKSCETDEPVRHLDVDAGRTSNMGRF